MAGVLAGEYILSSWTELSGYYFTTIYMTHIVQGSLGTSVFDPDVKLVGASGGVYALLTAHFANVVLNYNQMELGLLRIFGVFFVGKLILTLLLISFDE